MLIKRSVKNQIAIPKVVLESAGLGETDLYFDIVYERGRIVLTPMHVEEKIPIEAIRRFEARSMKPEKGDRVYSSIPEAIKGLRQGRA